MELAKTINTAKNNYDLEYLNRYDESHFGLDEKSKNEYNNKVKEIVNKLNNELNSNPSNDKIINAYSKAEHELINLKNTFRDNRAKVINNYETALETLIKSRELMNNIDRYSKLINDITNISNNANKSVDRENNYQLTTIENIVKNTAKLVKLNNSLANEKQALDGAFKNYIDALETVKRLKNNPKYSNLTQQLETSITKITNQINQNIADKDIDVEKYDDAAIALKAILVQAAKTRFNNLKTNANQVVNNRINNFDQISNTLDNLIHQLDTKVITSQEPDEIEGLFDELQNAINTATKQQEFAQKYNDIIMPTTEYQNIQKAVIGAMKPLKEDVLSSTNINQIQKDIDALTTNKYSEKIDKAIQKHNDVKTKIEELNAVKDNKFNSYPEAKKLIDDAISKYNNDTIVSDKISREISDKDALNTKNYDNVIKKLSETLTSAKNIKDATEKYNEELTNQLTSSDFVGYPDAKNKYENAVKIAKDNLAKSLVEAALNPTKIINAFKEAQTAIADAKAAVEKNKAIENFNKQISKLNTLKSQLVSINNDKKQHDNLTFNIDKAIEMSKSQLNYDSNFNNVTTEQIKEEITKLKQFATDTEAKKISVDEVVANYDSILTQINNLIKNDIDAEKDAVAQKAKLAVKNKLLTGIQNAKAILDAVNQNNFTSPEQKDAYHTAFETANENLQKIYNSAQDEIEHIDQVKHRLDDYEHISQNVIKNTIAEWTDSKYQQLKDKLTAILNTEDSKWLPVANKKLTEIKLEDVQASIDIIKKAFNEAKVEKAKVDFKTKYNQVLDILKDSKYKALKNALAEEMKTIFDEVQNITSTDDKKMLDGDTKVSQIHQLKAKLANFKEKADASKKAFDVLEDKTQEINNYKTQNLKQVKKAADWIDKSINENQVSTVTQSILDPNSYESKTINLDTAKAQADEINQVKTDYENEKQKQPSIDDSLDETKQWYVSETNKVDQGLTIKLDSINVNDPIYVQKVKQAYSDAKNEIATLKEQIAIKAAQQKHRDAVKALNNKLTQLNIDSKPELKGLRKQIQNIISESEKAVKAKEVTPYQNISSVKLEEEIEKLNNLKDSIDQEVNNIQAAKNEFNKIVKLVEDKTANPLYSAQKTELDNAKSASQQAITDAQNASSIDVDTYQHQAKLLTDKLIDQANDRFTKLIEKANELVKNNNLKDANRYQNLNNGLSQKINELNQQLPDKDDNQTSLVDKIKKAEDLYDELNKSIELSNIEKAEADYEFSKKNLTDTSNNLDTYPNTKKWLASEIEKINNDLTTKLATLQKDSATFVQDSINAYEQAQKDLEQVKSQINNKKNQETNEAQQAYQTSLATLEQNIANSTNPSREYIKTKLKSDKTSANNLVKSNPTPQDYADAKAVVDKANEFAQQQFPIADKDKAAVEKYTKLSEEVKSYLNSLNQSAPQYNKVKETLKNVKATQDSLARKEVKPYPKETIATGASNQLQKSLDQAKKDVTAIDDSVNKYNQQITLLDELVKDPKYKNAQQSDLLNNQKQTSQNVISAAQADKTITAQNYNDQTEALKTKIQEAAVNVYNSISSDVDKLLTELNKNSKLYKDEIDRLNAAKEVNNQNGTNVSNNYEIIAAAQDALQKAINQAAVTSLEKAKQAFENAKKQSQNEATQTTDPVLQQLKSEYENKLKQINDKLAQDIQNEENASPQKQRELYEGAQKALESVKSKFIEDKRQAKLNKNNEYIKLADEVQQYLNQTLTNGYNDINTALTAVKSHTDTTSGIGKNPSASQAQSDIDKLNEAYTLAKKQQVTRAQKLNNKISKDNLIATTKSQFPADAKYQTIKNSLDTAKTAAQDVLNSVLGNNQSTTSQINQAYDNYSLALTNAINKSSKAKEFKDKYDELVATVSDSKYETIRDTVDNLTQIKSAVEGLTNVDQTNIKVFEDGIAKISEIKEAVSESKKGLDSLDSKINSLHSLSNTHGNNDVSNLHHLLIDKLDSDGKPYRTSLLNSITNALEPSQYINAVNKVEMLSSNNTNANNTIGSFNNKEAQLRNLFIDEKDSQTKSKAIELLNADIDSVKGEVTHNINTFNNTYSTNNPTYQELNDKSNKIIAEYSAGKTKLESFERNKEKYLARAKYEVAKKHVSDKIAQFGNQPKYAGVRSHLESMLNLNNRDNPNSTPDMLRKAAKALDDAIKSVEIIKTKIDKIESKLNQSPFDKTKVIKGEFTKKNGAITNLDAANKLEQELESFKLLINDANSNIGSLRQSPQKTALENRLNEATTKEQISQIIKDAQLQKQDDIERAKKVSELQDLIKNLDNSTKTQFAVTNADNAQSVQNKINNAKSLIKTYNEAKNAVDDLKPGNSKNSLTNRLNQDSKTEPKLNRIIKDAKIEKARDAASVLSLSNPKRLQFLNKLNQIQANKDSAVPKELNELISELDNTYDVIKFAPSVATNYTPNTTITTRYTWKKEDVHGLLVVNQHGGKHANKYVYLMASSGNNHVISEPIILNSDVLKFTFKRESFNKNGVYYLSKVVISDKNNLTTQQVLQQSQDQFDKTYAQETRDFKVILSSLEAQNVKLSFRNNIPTDRVGNDAKYLEGANLIEAVTDNTIDITGFSSSDVQVLQNPPINVILVGRATFKGKNSTGGDITKELTHTLNISNGVAVYQDNLGHINFKFQSLELKAGYIYNVESISFEGHDRVTNKNNKFTWNKERSKGINIEYENDIYTPNQVSTNSYLFSLPKNKRDEILKIDKNNSIIPHYNQSTIIRLKFSNGWNSNTFGSLFNYLNTQIPETDGQYEAEIGNTKYTLKQKWIDFISNHVSNVLVDEKMSQWYTAIPTDTYYGLHNSATAIMLGYEKNMPFLDNVYDRQGTQLYPVIGGTDLYQDLANHNRTDLLGKVDTFTKVRGADLRRVLWSDTWSKLYSGWNRNVYYATTYNTIAEALKLMTELGRSDFKVK
ncbi:hypothetical protein KQ873_02815 [Mycoplasma zalophidermidis]|uniref:hypothetical protein n=1 Tax=Mycoplasma zalophidermidis TaxID=398174 RepID=UPI001C1011C9|nr:hypothetical protein [Mycoplasma zalophidermidis]MBU4689955.1 hypothetical protein [Mycoplasma zalophidermidis]